MAGEDRPLRQFRGGMLVSVLPPPPDLRSAPRGGGWRGGGWGYILGNT